MARNHKETKVRRLAAALYVVRPLRLIQAAIAISSGEFLFAPRPSQPLIQNESRNHHPAALADMSRSAGSEPLKPARLSTRTEV
jgi:hypothetical protein